MSNISVLTFPTFSADAFHPVRPDPAGTGASLSMSRAIDDAVRTLQSLDPELDSTKVSEQIGYINAHATATLAGDEAELLAIENVFRSGAKPLYISSCKSSMGHMMGAAGAAELILTLWALRTVSCFWNDSGTYPKLTLSPSFLRKRYQ